MCVYEKESEKERREYTRVLQWQGNRCGLGNYLNASARALLQFYFNAIKHSSGTCSRIRWLQGLAVW